MCAFPYKFRLLDYWSRGAKRINQRPIEDNDAVISRLLSDIRCHIDDITS